MLKIVADPGNSRVEVHIKNLSEKNKRGIRQAFYFIGRDLRNTAQKGILAKPKSGKIYYIRKGKKNARYRHQASAPGQMPANFTGKLRRSIRFLVHGWRKMEFGADAEYAKFLEEGTSRMAARPFLIKSIELNEKNSDQHFEREIHRANVNEAS